MLPAPHPSPELERARLESLRALGVLYTPPEERFDRITRIAAAVFDVPIALVSLVDSNRQWFKSCVGLAVSETERDISFCGHAILGDETFVVANALADDRFADNPLVLGSPNIRFYAGEPLRAPDGNRVGTLCIIDQQPRELSNSEQALLRDLAAIVEEELRSVELRRATAALKESHARLAGVTEAVVDGLVIVDQQRRIESVNAASERMFGRTRLDLRGLGFETLVADTHCETVKALFDSATRASGAAHDAPREVAGVRHDRSTFPMDIAMSRMDWDGNTTFIAILRDVTERKQAEEERNRFFALSPEMLCIAGFDGYFKDLNPSWETVLGYSIEELLGRPFLEFVHPEDRERTASEAARLANGGVTIEFENRYHCRDGSYRWLQWSAASSPGQGAIHAVARDITQRKETEDALAHETHEREQAEEALRESEQLYRSVISAMEEGVLVHDEQGLITACNASAERILGIPAGRLIGRSPLDPRWRAIRRDGSPFPGEENPPVQTLRTGRPCSGEIMGIHVPDGEIRWLSVNSQPLLRPGEEAPHAAVSSFADVTERLLVDRMKDEFVSVVSHELRTPLTSIRGALGLLAGGALGELPERAAQMLEIAASNTDRLVRLINDILDIERMESGQIAMAKEHVDLADLFERTVELMEPLAVEHGLMLEAIPRAAPLWVDPDRIVQALTNLVSNAIKFSPTGGTVRISADASSSEVVVSVRDEGRGIPKDMHDAIFERFQQVDASDSRERGGTGLGLAISRSIVEQHGGRMWVESAPGLGSTFTFAIPHADSQQVAQPDGGGATRPCILVCDDDHSMRQVVAATLERHGYGVLTAAGGRQAVDIARLHRPDALLLDLVMPEQDGWETMAALKEDPRTRDIPVVIFSGVDGSNAGGASTESAGWVTKPHDEALLIDTLERALAAKKAVARVLVIEDDADLAQVLEEVFRRNGATAVSAPTAREGIAMSQSLLPDLVVLDLVLPDGDGFEVVDWLRRHDRLRSTPLVVYTARDLGPDDRDRLRLGETAFLTKGRATPEQFEKRVVDLLARITSNTAEAAA